MLKFIGKDFTVTVRSFKIITIKSLQDTFIILQDCYKHSQWKVIPKDVFKNLIQITLCLKQFIIFFWIIFKACVCYFLSDFHFSPNHSPSKAVKILFHLKSSFCSQDIQIFLFQFSPLFLPVSHCFRCCLEIHLKVYGIQIETLSIDRVLNKEYFYGEIMQKMCTKSNPRPLFNFGK